MLYCAQEADLFNRYDVRVQIIELNSSEECRMAFVDGYVDAVVLDYDEYLKVESSGALAGIFMLMAAPRDSSHSSKVLEERTFWKNHGIELLIGDRPGLMQRRQEWQRVLQAYEHARMLITGEMAAQAGVISGFERRDSSSVHKELIRWELFGIMHQDSLLDNAGPYSALNAKWQGRQFLTSAATSQFVRLRNDAVSVPSGDKAR